MVSVPTGYCGFLALHIIIRYGHRDSSVCYNVHSLVRPLVLPSVSPSVGLSVGAYQHRNKRMVLFLYNVSVQVNVTYIGNESKVALVAPFIAATGASWPEKFGRNIKMV